MRSCVGAEPHIDPGAQIVAEIFHYLAIAGKWRRTVGDRCAGFGNQLEIGLGPPADPRMGIEEKRVAENRVGAEDADLVRPLDWRLAVAADHFPHLADALRDVYSKGQRALARRIAAVAQQIGGASVDLHRRDDAGEAPARVPGSIVDRRQRRCKTFASARIVPGVLQIEIIGETPARRGIARSEETAHPAPGTQLDPTVPR